MEPYRLLIQQTSYNGVEYTKGPVVDTLDRWGIVCSESPFRIHGDPKDAVTRDWLDEHGVDAYIPKESYLKSFTAEFTFLCTGSVDDVRANMGDFFKFLCGAGSDSVGARLVIYDEYNKVGWKDVRYKSHNPDALLMYDVLDVVSKFKVTFDVFDPATEVTLNGGNLTWQD